MPSDPETDALLAVARALTEDEQRDLMAVTAARWPRLDGADPADVLDLTDNADMFLDVRGLRYAAHALIILARPLTGPAVLDIVRRAGLEG